jgi:DNA-binding MarR family transcriptional regulator
MAEGYYESALLRLRRVTGYLSMRYGNVVKDSDITPVQFEILLFVDSCAPCSISDIAQFMVVDKSTSSRVLRGVQDRHWIDVETDQDDRRKRRVMLTAEGKSLVEQYRADWFEVEKDVVGKYDTAIGHLERV